MKSDLDVRNRSECVAMPLDGEVWHAGLAIGRAQDEVTTGLMSFFMLLDLLLLALAWFWFKG